MKTFRNSFNEECKAYYYYNTITKVCQWEHPLDAEHKTLVERARKQYSATGTIPLHDLSEDASQYDSGIRSLQGDDSDLATDISPSSRNMDLPMAVGRFLAPLERNKPLTPLTPLATSNTRHKRFEMTNHSTNNPLPTTVRSPAATHQIDLSIKNNQMLKQIDDEASMPSPQVKSFTLSGKGAMFLKSNANKKIVSGEAKTSIVSLPTEEAFGGDDKLVKSILRNSSLTNVFKRNENQIVDAIDVDDKKNVRFNLNVNDSGNMDNDAMSSVETSESDENIENISEEKYVRDVKVTIGKLTEANEMPTDGQTDMPKVSFNRKLNSNDSIKPLYDDTDSDSIRSIKAFSRNAQPPNQSERMSQISEENKQQMSIKQLELNEKLNGDRELFERQYEAKRMELQQEYKHRLDELKQQLDDEAKDRKIEIESQHNMAVEEFKKQLKDEFDVLRKSLLAKQRKNEEELRAEHEKAIEEFERDVKIEEDLLRKDHSMKFTQVKETMSHELELERQRMRDTGENHLYEKVRCEKRLLEDKYRCLKEKYVRLKTDLKISLDRRNQRRERMMAASTNAQQNVANEIRSSSVSTGSSNVDIGRPPPPLSSQRKPNESNHERGHSVDKSGKKFGVAAKYLSHIQQHNYDDTTSISQSDTTISNNRPQHHRPMASQSAAAQANNGNSDSEAFNSTLTSVHETNNNQRDDHGRSRKKTFARSKSASTSRLNVNDTDHAQRPCTPVENLRQQLRKLEDLEDQFPDCSMDGTYHLRYPFSADSAKNQFGPSSELEFFKHRIHLERDSVRRAKESLRNQRTNFRLRQREIKHRHKNATRHTIDQMIQEEKELTEMEVNLHRTRALLGEKVIRLRHLEMSLQRLHDGDKMSVLSGQSPIDDKFSNRDDATISDLSSHSSSGFSSTDFASDAQQAHVTNKQKEMFQESGEIIQSLENLNAEIREIWGILSKQQHGKR